MKKEPFLTATVLLNFAELLDDMCIHPHAREIHYPGPVYGDHGCDGSIKDRFLPYLKEIIYVRNPCKLNILSSIKNAILSILHYFPNLLFNITTFSFFLER